MNVRRSIHVLSGMSAVTFLVAGATVFRGDILRFNRWPSVDQSRAAPALHLPDEPAGHSLASASRGRAVVLHRPVTGVGGPVLLATRAAPAAAGGTQRGGGQRITVTLPSGADTAPAKRSPDFAPGAGTGAAPQAGADTSLDGAAVASIGAGTASGSFAGTAAGAGPQGASGSGSFAPAVPRVSSAPADLAPAAEPEDASTAIDNAPAPTEAIVLSPSVVPAVPVAAAPTAPAVEAPAALVPPAAPTQSAPADAPHAPQAPAPDPTAPVVAPAPADPAGGLSTPPSSQGTGDAAPADAPPVSR